MFTPSAILEFWFGNQKNMLEINSEKSSLWWGKDSDIDQNMSYLFRPLIDFIHTGSQYDFWRNQPDGCLASILTLDQFPRNIFRGTPQSYFYDAMARELAEQFISKGFDQAMTPLQCVFAYLPFEHSEDLKDQERSVVLFKKLLDMVGPAERQMFRGFLEYAIKHREIIEKFGRFPHRNQILGRTSSAEELDFLKLPGSFF
ncbi:MAG: DUF924 domain-containing protein [Gammaproteobacteria bacterium]|nr:DUF924 domain-containing protein [Gammaproteobacteria bacterium]MCY4274293.1 DUF924 domain-containing protein [Gammaproteobacteria bacterium]